jgi:hypothetical protein
MLSRETLEAYRRMTTSQRLEIALEMMRSNMDRMFNGPPEIVDRRFELLRRQNDERNRRMLAAFARTRTPP